MVQISQNRFIGKKPARAGAIKLGIADYVDISKLPPVPPNFGHDKLVADYGMLANDRAGCCVWSGAAHETMLWNAMAGRTVHFTDTDVLEDYTAVTGYNPADPSTDQGTDMVTAAEYRQKTGVRDNTGARHKIAAYLAIDATKLDQLWAAAYLFGAVGIGIQLPDSAETQFDAGQEWTVVPGSQNSGGHYVPLSGRKNGILYIVTWGKLQPVSLGFLQTYVDEAVAYCSEEALVNGKSLLGFDSAALLADLGSMQKAA